MYKFPLPVDAFSSHFLSPQRVLQITQNLQGTRSGEGREWTTYCEDLEKKIL